MPYPGGANELDRSNMELSNGAEPLDVLLAELNAASQ